MKKTLRSMADDALENPGAFVLVADVGGTNCRFALGQAGKVLATTALTFRNADHPDFYAALDTYLDRQGRPDIAVCGIAIAGPITCRVGALTNLDWHFDARKIEAQTGAEKVTLLNDLEALGHALDGLSPQETLDLNGPDTTANSNGQSLIVGAGTGLNGCAVLANADANPVVLRAEIGHSSMPFSLVRYLSEQSVAGDFPTVEDFFCGRRLASLYAAHGGAPDTDPQVITARHNTAQDPAASRAVGQMQHMLGLLCRQLSYLYLPMDGIYLAGSVARGVLGGDDVSEFLRAYRAQGKFGAAMASIPVSLLTQDETALNGCMRAVSGA